MARGSGRGAALAIAGLLLTLIAGGCAASPDGSVQGGSGDASSTATSSSTAQGGSGTPLPPGTFPSTVAGLPVISPSRATALIETGQLDGQAVAVAGYYNAAVLPCPFPMRYIGPLESWCSPVVLAGTKDGARLCQSDGSNGTSCSAPTGTHVTPFFMPETSGSPNTWLTGGGSGDPVPFVLIGHAGDPRQWQCTAATRDACSHAFVVDRIAWAQGADIPLAVPETGEVMSGAPITPKLSLAGAAAAAGVADSVVTAAPFKAGDIDTVDPRWNLAGDDLVWVVRSASGPAPSGADVTLPETVTLIDDATGKVLGTQPMKVDPGYQPAQLWSMATVHGQDCCAGDIQAFLRVQSADGTVVHEGLVAGGESGGQDATTFGGNGYGSLPIVLSAGDYTVGNWLATYSNGVAGKPTGECSTHVTLQPVDNVTLNADYPAGKACTFQPAPSPSPGS
jgi:hypothetical protein